MQWCIDETGPSSVLEVVERDLPEPGPGEVRVRLVRAGVNPTDWKFRTGAAMTFDEVTPGQDGAGVVDAVGDGVDGARGRAAGVADPRAARAPATAPPPSTPCSRAGSSSRCPTPRRSTSARRSGSPRSPPTGR